MAKLAASEPSNRFQPSASTNSISLKGSATSTGETIIIPIDISRLARFDRGCKPADVPFTVIVPAFVASELKSAFQIGFMIFIPFLIIDMIVASVLMSLGMMMLSPVLVSLPFKLMLFVLADGWNLLLGSLAASFAT